MIQQQQQQQQQQQNSNQQQQLQQHALSSQQSHSSNHNLHQADKIGGAASVTVDGSMSNSFRGTDQVSSLLLDLFCEDCIFVNIFSPSLGKLQILLEASLWMNMRS